jgi:hypothetical protein
MTPLASMMGVLRVIFEKVRLVELDRDGLSVDAGDVHEPDDLHGERLAQEGGPQEPGTRPIEARRCEAGPPVRTRC